MLTYTNRLESSVVVIVITGFTFFFARLVIVLAFLHRFSGASFSFLLLKHLAAQILNLFEIQSRGVFFGHSSQLTLLPFPLLVLQMILLLELILLELDGLDLEVLVGLGPAARRIRLKL